MKFVKITKCTGTTYEHPFTREIAEFEDLIDNVAKSFLNDQFGTEGFTSCEVNTKYTPVSLDETDESLFTNAIPVFTTRYEFDFEIHDSKFFVVEEKN